MTRITDLLAKNKNADQRPYRFLVISQNSWFPVIYELKFAPDGWTDEIIYQRSDKYKGIFRRYHEGELKFPKDGRDYLQNLYRLHGIIANAALIVYKLDYSSFEFVKHFVGVLDFSTYKIDKTFVSIQVLDNVFAEKVRNRENIEVDLLTRDTIDGNIMPAFANKNKELQFPATVINKHAVWEMTSDLLEFGLGETIPSSNYYFKMPLIYSEIDEAQDIEAGQFSTPQYYVDSVSDDTNANLIVKMKARLYNITGDPAVVYMVRLYCDGSNEGEILLAEQQVFGQKEITLDVDIEQALTLAAGQQLSLYLTLYRNPQLCTLTPCKRYLEITNQFIRLEYQFAELSESFCTALPIYEAFLRACQKITNVTDCFESEYFGRTDSEVRTYASDGQLGHITNGKLIRRLNAYYLNEDVSLNVSLEDLFKTINSVFNIGLGIEVDGEAYRVRVENEAYFFDENVILDISDQINEDDIEKEVLPGWHYAQIKTGYAKKENEIGGAIFEFNGKQTFGTRISTLAPIENTLEIVSQFRADTNGIIILRQALSAAGEETEDVDGDNDNFIIDSVRSPDPLVNFVARTNEGFDVIDGNIDSGEYFNCDLTPKRNMLRHGGRIRAGLEKALNSELRFQTKDSVVELETRKTGETDSVIEATDQVVNDLSAPRWWPEKYILEAPLRREDILAIEANPRGLIKLSDTKFGWILKIKSNRDNKAKYELLRCNLDHVTPVE